MMPKRRMLLNSDEKRKTLQNVAMARGRLKGALNNKNVSSDDNSESEDSAEEGEQKRHKLDTNIEPYMMKLFDRSIDLAQFRHNSPLYPVCRAWSKNQPRTTDTPEPEVKVPRSAIKREFNPDIVEQFMNGDLSEITEMPRPEPAGNMLPYYIDVAEPVEDIEFNQSSLERDELLNEHLTKWKAIREKWISHRKQYETKRYGTSFRLLEVLKRNE